MDGFNLFGSIGFGAEPQVLEIMAERLGYSASFLADELFFLLLVNITAPSLL